MCQSRADGGRRCHGHARARFARLDARPGPGDRRWAHAAAELASTDQGKAEIGALADHALRAGDTARAAALDAALTEGARLRDRHERAGAARRAGDQVAADAAAQAEPGTNPSHALAVLARLRRENADAPAPGDEHRRWVAEHWDRIAAQTDDPALRRRIRALAKATRNGGPLPDGPALAAWRALPAELGQQRLDRVAAAASTAHPDGTRTWTGTHATGPQAWEAIAEHGFRAGTGQSGNAADGDPLWGSGVYLALDDPSARLWDRPGTSRRTVTARLRHVLAYDYGPYGQARRDTDVLAGRAAASAPRRDLPALRAAVSAEIERCSRLGGGSRPEDADRIARAADADLTVQERMLRGRAAIDLARAYRAEHGSAEGTRRYLTDLGWDAVLVSEPSPTRHGGGDQLLVLDPARAHVH